MSCGEHYCFVSLVDALPVGQMNSDCITHYLCSVKYANGLKSRSLHNRYTLRMDICLSHDIEDGGFDGKQNRTSNLKIFTDLFLHSLR